MHFSLCIVNLLVLKNSDFQETKALREGLHVFDFNVEFFEQEGGQLQNLSSIQLVFLQKSILQRSTDVTSFCMQF